MIFAKNEKSSVTVNSHAHIASERAAQLHVFSRLQRCAVYGLLEILPTVLHLPTSKSIGIAATSKDSSREQWRLEYNDADENK